MTDLLLGLVRRGTTQDLTNYETHGPDGRAIRSSTLFLRDADGVAIGCLCVNRLTDGAPRADGHEPETFPPDVDSLQRFLIGRAVTKAGIPVDLMKKRHRRPRSGNWTRRGSSSSRTGWTTSPVNSTSRGTRSTTT